MDWRYAAFAESGFSQEAAAYTNPGMQANLVLRVFFGILAALCCLVPMKLLWRNGEFAAAIFCLDVIVLNVFYTVNALIWQDENVGSWWPGYGWCDLQVYLIYALDTLYSACVFEIMRNLAGKVALSRVTGLTSGEKRRQTVISALVLFPIPLFQVAFTWFIISQRYSIAPLIGCLSIYDSSWPYLVFYVLPAPVFTIAGVIAAGLTWKRFREVDRATRELLSSGGSDRAIRQARIRRKLYFLTLAILVPYSVVQMLFLVGNITSQPSWSRPYDYYQLHFRTEPYPWDFIPYILTDQLDFASLNTNYIPVLTVLPLFISFGTTKEAINTYRRCLLLLGLGKVFPELKEEYDPDAGGSHDSKATWTSRVTSVFRSKSKETDLPTAQHVSFASRNRSTSGASNRQDKEAVVTLAPVEPVGSSGSNTATAPKDENPWPDLSGRSLPRAKEEPLPQRNPWLTRTSLSATGNFLPTAIPSVFKKKAPTAESGPLHRSPHRGLELIDTTKVAFDAAEQWSETPGGSRVHTRVWSEEATDTTSTTPPSRKPSDGVTPGEPRSGDVRIETHIASSSEHDA